MRKPSFTKLSHLCMVVGGAVLSSALQDPAYAAFKMAPTSPPVAAAPTATALDKPGVVNGDPIPLVPTDVDAVHTIRGAGRDLPLDNLAAAIVPPSIKVSFEPAALASHVGSFTGNNRDWRTVWQETLAGAGMTMRENGNTMTVVLLDAPSVPAPATPAGPPPAIEVTAAPLPPSEPISVEAAPSKPPASPAALGAAARQIAIAQPEATELPNIPFGAAPSAPDFGDIMQPREWTVDAGSTLVETVSRWADELGLPRPDDKTGHVWHLDYAGTFHGTYIQALEWLVQGLADQPPQPDWRFSRVNLVTILVLKGAR